MTEYVREQACITNDIIRLSVGLENSDDPIEDLSKGLDNS